MIVVSCRRHESVLIGSEIKILVVDVNNDAVRMAVDAPKNMSVQTREKFDTFQGGVLRQEETKRRAPSMTIAQRLRGAIQASGQGLDRLAMQINLPTETLENFVRRGEDLPLSSVQRIVSHFKLQLTEPGSEESEGG